MLIRWANQSDKEAWVKLAKNIGEDMEHQKMYCDKEFLDYADSKLSKFETLIAVDRMSENCLGVIGFSRTNNRITWFAVGRDYRNKGVGSRLLMTALRQLENTKEITVTTFPDGYHLGHGARATYKKFGFIDKKTDFHNILGEVKPRSVMALAPTNIKRGGSFHYKYLNYDKYSKKENCHACQNLPMPDELVDIAELRYSFATAEREAQGKLFGKCHVLIKNHYVNFEDIPLEEMSGFMSEVQKVGAALRKVTGAIKINYEIHANSGPHIHCHLFPRYLDDDFPSAPIDYRVTEPSPYESDEEFDWFVGEMRKELDK